MDAKKQPRRTFQPGRQMGSRRALARTGPAGFADSLKGLCLLAACLFLFGCAALHQPPRPEAPPASELWHSFRSRITERAIHPAGFSLKASLSYSSAAESHRVRLSMWGNYQLPLRLDLSSGFGSPFSLWQLTAERWLAYQPGRGRAYIHTDSRRGAASLGIQTPFGLQTLSRILTADWITLLPIGYDQATAIEGSGYRFTLNHNGPVDSLVLDRQARLVAMQGRSPHPWTLHLEDPEVFGARQVPTKLTLKSETGYTVRVHIKELSLRSDPWTKSSLQLDLPKDTMIVPLQYSKP